MTLREQIAKSRNILDQIEKIADQHGAELERAVVGISFLTTKPALYVKAGFEPRALAKLFGNRVKAYDDTWEIDLQDFYVCFLDAIPPRPEAKEVEL